MSLRSLLDDPVVNHLLNSKKLAYGLLTCINNELRMLSASKKYRQSIGFGSDRDFLFARYGKWIYESWQESMLAESGWTGNVWLDNKWHKVELWNHGRYGLLFERPLKESELSSRSEFHEPPVEQVSEEPAAQMTETIGSVLIQMDNHGKVIRLNEALCRFFKQTNDNMQGLDASHLVFVNDMGHYKRLFNTVSFKQAMCDGSFSLRNADGEVHRFDWTAVADGKQVILIGKSSQKHLEDALVKSEERLNNILETMNEAFFAIDDQGFITYINAKGAELLGRSPGALLGRLLSERAPALKNTPLFEHLNRSRGLKQSEIFQWEDTKTRQWYQVKTYPSEDLISVFFSDISDIKKTENNARHQAMHDSLTGLPNRLSLKQTLAELMDDDNVVDITMGLLFIDLDGFKSINDTLGHNAGDQLLQQVALRLQEAVRTSDVVARLSGDEFVIMLPYINGSEDAYKVGQKIVEQISKSAFKLEKKEVYMGASVGVAIFPDDSRTVEGLLKSADIAMYEAKQAGKNTVRMFKSSMTANLHAKLNLEYDLNEAIRFKRFELHYQPRFNRNGDIVAAEALVRMRSKQGDLVPPSEFIPMAEQTGLIVPLGTMVMEMACEWAKGLNEQLIVPVAVSVNVSGAQIFTGNLPATVERILRDSGLSSSLLELELTETMLIQNEERVVMDLETLHAMGIKLSVDDFGTGYSSLSLLQKMPVQTIKLDRSFVEGLPHQHDNVVISRSVCALAKSMELGLVAEGIETEAQKTFLIEAGFDELQGFGLSRPLPAHQATNYILACAKQKAIA